MDEPMDVSDSESDNDSLVSCNDRDITYKVLTIGEVTHKMDQVIQELVSETKLSPPIARIALSYHDWDKWKLLKELYSDQDTFFKNINVVNPSQEMASTSKASRGSSASDSIGECPTCCEEFQSNALVALNCNHMFCKDCWSQYLTVKINEGSELISCQNPNCSIIVDDPTVEQLLTDGKTKARYKKLITNSFVLSEDQLMEWCPGADCTNAIEASNTPIHRLNCTCECGHEFCFKCRDAHHEPMPCNLYKTWQNQTADANLRYILKNTKPCPKCDCLIEKNMGCHYMYCTRCRTEFCWVCSKKCFADWRRGHGMCNTPLTERPPQSDDGSRFKLYNAKYQNHRENFDVEIMCIKTKIDQALARWVRGGMTQADVSQKMTVLYRSLGIVLACRKSLMISYIFAYFIKGKNDQKATFEENQIKLEDAVKDLSEYLQSYKSYERLVDVMGKIKAKTDYCDRHRTMLHDYIFEGLDHQWWTFYEE